MDGTWRRVLIGSAVAIMILGLGALEIIADRVRVEPAPTTASGSADEQTGSQWREVLNLQGHLLSFELGPPADWNTAGPNSGGRGGLSSEAR
jgi:hypothetical protein